MVTQKTQRRLDALLSASETATHYELLGVHASVTKAELDVARRELMLQLHPDRHQDNRTASLVSAAVNAAYDTLVDPVKHNQYRAKLVHGREACPTCGGKGALKRMKGFTAATHTTCVSCGGLGLVARKKKEPRK